MAFRDKLHHNQVREGRKLEDQDPRSVGSTQEQLLSAREHRMNTNEKDGEMQ